MPGTYLKWKPAAIEAVRARFGVELARMGGNVQRKAKVYCPVDTGRLRDSITVIADIKGLRVVIGSNVNYASFQEWGVPSRNVPAVHFMRRALEEEIATFSFRT